MKFKVRIPLQYVKPVCIAAVLVGIFAVAAGSWITGLCLLLGAYLLEKSCYRCPHCGKKLDMKYPLFKRVDFEDSDIRQLLPGLQGRAAPGSRKKRREIIGLFSARRLRYNKA